MYGTNGVSFGAEVDATTFASGPSGWRSFHTNNPTYPLLTSDPDTHGGHVSTFVNGPSDATFIDPSVRNYTIKATSPLYGAALGGGNPGYDPTNCGPGW